MSKEPNLPQMKADLWQAMKWFARSSRFASPLPLPDALLVEELSSLLAERLREIDGIATGEPLRLLLAKMVNRTSLSPTEIDALMRIITECPDEISRGLATLISFQHPSQLVQPQILAFCSQYHPDTLREVVEILTTMRQASKDLGVCEKLLARLDQFARG